MSKSKVRRRGNSRSVHLPGDAVENPVDDHRILVRKVSGGKPDLAELVSRIPRGFKAKEVCFGPPVGNEE